MCLYLFSKSLAVHPARKLATTSNVLSHYSSITNQNHIDSCHRDVFIELSPNFTTTNSISHSYLTTTMTTSKMKNSLSLLSSSSSTNNNDLLPANTNSILSSLPLCREQSSTLSSPILYSILTNNQSTSTIDNNDKLSLTQQSSSQHITKMKVIQSSSTNLSDFISSTPTSTLQTTSKKSSILSK